MLPMLLSRSSPSRQLFQLRLNNHSLSEMSPSPSRTARVTRSRAIGVLQSYQFSPRYHLIRPKGHHTRACTSHYTGPDVVTQVLKLKNALTFSSSPSDTRSMHSTCHYPAENTWLPWDHHGRKTRSSNYIQNVEPRPKRESRRSYTGCSGSRAA